ncbi:hypothetical protein [Thalassobacillus sp. C254]|uniref:hypothetical protein n=1 Tax=Thalassobacillus sp. C254 TaxID=1225341 RepID=UPI0006D0F9B9|nr:hypothetical protein [Thalassobacillus sp. C254]
MGKTKGIFMLIFAAALAVLFFSIEGARQYPYALAVIIIFAVSLAGFFTFMRFLTTAWYQSGFAANALIIVLIPVVEDTGFWVLSAILLGVLSSTQIAWYLLHSQSDK